MNKLKTEKNTLILTTLIILLPILAGLLLWNRLPEKIPTHFDFQGNPDGWSSRRTAVFFLPLFLTAVHLLCAFITAYDPKERGVSVKIYRLILWIVPVLSVFLNGLVYAYALGKDVNISTASYALIGLTLIIIGNYLPKVRQNMTVGIKIPWTLTDETNWNLTHRLAGRLWIIAGIVIIASTFMSNSVAPFIMLGAVLCCTLIPCVYSFLLYRKTL
ncbi:MAG: DUF1648 domain-containing protein [Solobacterium sp.]|nr:DUF1648 domain-containing protein [Solobacterium sp.]MBQ6592569.1 DUF1648 domain-containing protein [Solobacterium sp.]MBR0478894.1 DUF1648 domain-containing protein [Solobacterium sp.]